MNQSRYHTLPLEAQYLYRRGLEMVHRQEEQRALTLFRQAVFIAPDFTKAYHEMGSCLRGWDDGKKLLHPSGRRRGIRIRTSIHPCSYMPEVSSAFFG